MEREAEGPVAEGASLDDRMARIGQFAAAKRSIQATFDAKAREMQAQEATLGIISTRKAERDRVRAEREAAARTKKVAEEQLEKLHLEGVAEVEAVHRLLAEFLDGGSTADPVEMATSAHSRLTRSLQFLAPASYDGTGGQRGADQATKEQIAQLRQEVRAAEAKERRLHEQETELVLEAEESPGKLAGQGLAPAPAGAGGDVRHSHGDDDLARVIAEKDEQIQKLIQQVAGMQIQIEKAHCANIKIGELVFQQDQDSQLRALLDSHLSGNQDDANGALAEMESGGDQDADSRHRRRRADAEDEEREDAGDEGGEESDPHTVMDGDMVVVAGGAQVSAEAARDLSNEREREGERRKARASDAEDELSFQDIIDVGHSLANSAVDEGSKVMAKVMRAASPARWRPLEGVLNFAGIRGLSPARSRPAATPAESDKTTPPTEEAPEGGDSKENLLAPGAGEGVPKPPGMPRMTAMMEPPPEMARRRGTSSSKYAVGGSRGMPAGSKLPGMSLSSRGVPNVSATQPLATTEQETSTAKYDEPSSAEDTASI